MSSKTKENKTEKEISVDIPPEIVSAFKSKDMGYSLLLKGKAGVGKSTFAISLLSYFKKLTPIYMSTRVAPTSIYTQFPWIKKQLKTENIIDASRTYIPPTNVKAVKEHFQHTIRYETIEEFMDLIYKKLAKIKNPILVIDSWDAIVSSQKEPTTKIETLFTEFVRQSKIKLILIAESETPNLFLEYIVDGVVTLRDSDILGRTFRTISVDKIRGVERQQKTYAFTLFNNHFRYIRPYKKEEVDSISSFQPIPDEKDQFSTGNLVLDKIYGGGLRPGTFNLLEIESKVPISAISSVFIGMLCQFVAQGRGAIIRATEGINSDLLQKKRLFLYLDTALISKYLRILQTQISDRNEIRPYIRQTTDENFNDDFFSIYSKLSSSTKFQPVFAGISYDSLNFMVDFNRAMSRFEQHLKYVRNSNLIEVGIINSLIDDTKVSHQIALLNENLSYVASTHMKIIERHGSIFLYSIKPRSSSMYAIKTEYAKGYPQITLLPIV